MLDTLHVQTDPEDDEMYEWADSIRDVMLTRPRPGGWTASLMARYARKPSGERLTTVEAGMTMSWMVDNRYIECDERGAWTHYYPRQRDLA